MVGYSIHNVGSVLVTLMDGIIARASAPQPSYTVAILIITGATMLADEPLAHEWLYADEACQH